MTLVEYVKTQSRDAAIWYGGLGLQSARLLTERIKGRSAAEHYVITPRLVARGSSRGKER